MAILTAVCFLFARSTHAVPQLTVNSSEGVADTAVPQCTSERSARSVSQGSTSAVHLVSCQPVPQTPLTVPENSFMASLEQEASARFRRSVSTIVQKKFLGTLVELH